jgi:hypothetical protein
LRCGTVLNNLKAQLAAKSVDVRRICWLDSLQSPGRPPRSGLADLHELYIAGATNGSFDPAIADLPKAQSEAASTLLEAA